NLGFVYHQAGLARTAHESFKEALKWDPENPIALKYFYNADKGGKSTIMGGLKSLFKRSPSK
ncbi:MAG: hypothetical protein HY770_00995, partial [Chitinivibrionia bacterium]|nr:hypothetical protein [Chitinivibrionia bacterium]